MDWTSIRATALEIAETKGVEYSDPNLPGTRLRRLATDLGVDRMELHEMEGDALVVERTPGHYTMFLNSSHVKVRHRFSTAHEVAHLLLSPIVNHRAIHRRRFSPKQDFEGRRIEILCNDMASAILMPRRRVEAFLNQTRPTAQCVPNLVKDFNVSFEAAARRYVSVVSLPCSLVVWSTQSGTRREERPISNFAFRGGMLKFPEMVPSRFSGTDAIGDITTSEEPVIVYPGSYSRLAPLYLKKATVETLCHGHGQYRRMYSFVYLPDQIVKSLLPYPKRRRTLG